MVLSAADLAYMRGTSAELMPDTCVIQQATSTADGSGGSTRSWAARLSDVPCRVDRVSEAEQVRNADVAGGPAVMADWVVTVAYGVSCALTERVVANGLTLEPVAVNIGRSWKTATRIFCREVTR